MHLRVQQIVKTNWVLTGDGSPQSGFGIQKSRFECVHAGIAKTLGHFGAHKGSRASDRAIDSTLLFVPCPTSK